MRGIALSVVRRLWSRSCSRHRRGLPLREREGRPGADAQVRAGIGRNARIGKHSFLKVATCDIDAWGQGVGEKLGTKQERERERERDKERQRER